MNETIVSLHSRESQDETKHLKSSTVRHATKMSSFLTPIIIKLSTIIQGFDLQLSLER